MSESEFFVCKHCGKEHEATNELASFLCPKLLRTKGIYKVLDTVRLKSLTGNIGLSESQEHKIFRKNYGEPNEKEK